jgi:hypothetical protein
VKPIGRRDGVLVRELPDELIVYDLERHQAHCLNRTAALVFRLSDGTRTSAEIAAMLGDTDPDERQAVVSLALRQLAELSLVDVDLQPAAVDDAPAQADRRDALRRLGVGAALLLPAVVSMLAPTPAAAASCVTDCVSQDDGVQCHCVISSPCNGTCVGGMCTSGGGC